MPFCWSAVPLFGQDGALSRFPGNTTGSAQVVSFPELYRQEPNKLTDVDMMRFLAELGRPGKGFNHKNAKMKCHFFILVVVRYIIFYS